MEKNFKANRLLLIISVGIIMYLIGIMVPFIANDPKMVLIFAASTIISMLVCPIAFIVSLVDGKQEIPETIFKVKKIFFSFELCLLMLLAGVITHHFLGIQKAIIVLFSLIIILVIIASLKLSSIFTHAKKIEDEK